MKYKSSSLDLALSYIEKLPSDLRAQAFKAIEDERDRLNRGNYTEDEKLFFKSAQELGIAVSKNRATIALEVFYKDLCEPCRLADRLPDCEDKERPR